MNRDTSGLIEEKIQSAKTISESLSESAWTPLMKAIRASPNLSSLEMIERLVDAEFPLPDDLVQLYGEWVAFQSEMAAKEFANRISYFKETLTRLGYQYHDIVSEESLFDVWTGPTGKKVFLVNADDMDLEDD